MKFKIMIARLEDVQVAKSWKRQIWEKGFSHKEVTCKTLFDLCNSTFKNLRQMNTLVYNYVFFRIKQSSKT